MGGFLLVGWELRAIGPRIGGPLTAITGPGQKGRLFFLFF